MLGSSFVLECFAIQTEGALAHAILDYEVVEHNGHYRRIRAFFATINDFGLKLVNALMQVTKRSE